MKRKETISRVAATRIRLALACAGALASAPAPALDHGEYVALRAIYDATNGDAWFDRAGWDADVEADVCDDGAGNAWTGVVCDPGTGHVVEILLAGNNLTGSLPDLRGLPEVHYFDFDFNAIGGTLASAHLESLAQLDTFHAVHNLLRGTIPSLQSLSLLQEFIVSENELTGPLPDIDGLTLLGNFDVSYNFLSGPIPSATVDGAPGFDGLPNLREFTVSHNELTGSIPYLGHLHALTAFRVGDNRLSGVLPAVPLGAGGETILNEGDSTLCPNALIDRPDPAWDDATGESLLGRTWYFDDAFPGGACSELVFANGFDARELPIAPRRVGAMVPMEETP
ncbi:MAG TPA: hypothetical protein VKB52_15565 [Rhodanobacteraceae bacterium]|nr:hypothetical protein [Rhodanobacteraceae bacterium]